MNLFSLLAARSPNKVFLAILVGIVSGVAYSLLIPILMSSLGGLEDGDGQRIGVLGVGVIHPGTAFVYLAVVVFVWLSRTWVDFAMAGESSEATSRMRVDMYDQIARAPLIAIERIGLSRLVTAFVSDMPCVMQGATAAQTFLIDLVTLTGMLGYLAYLHLGVFFFVLKCIVVGLLSYLLILAVAGRYFSRASRVNDQLLRSVQGLTQGFKELKLGEAKRREYFDSMLLRTEVELMAAQRAASLVHSSASNYGLMLNFLILGGVAFIFVSDHALDAESLSSIVMVMLYISMPIGSVTSKIPELTRSRIAVARVRALMSELPAESASTTLLPCPAWDRISFEGVTYTHAASHGGEGFTVGPLDLEFRKGEITFVVGGNGSGKSTLSKLLTLHYHASAGAILFSNERISDRNINSYRQEISAIFSDYHLFDRILSGQHDFRQVDHLLEKFGLAGKVTYADGRFSTLSLSDGQRRRLALVVTFVEDRDLFVFDEWAADQDPDFKEIFYRQILPSLKARGKAVVVISHDDRYFDVADKVIVMCEGKVQSVSAAVTLAKQLAPAG